MNDSMNGKGSRLFVGAAKADITPDFGTQISGDIGRFRPVEEIRDRLYARIFVLKSGGHTVCLILCDMACIQRNLGLQIRAKIADVLEMAPDDVMIHCVQSHSAARVGGMFDDVNHILPPDLWWVRGETPAYNELFTKQIMEGVHRAKTTVPARLRAARAIDNRCAFNRRFVMRDGSAKTHPGNCDPNILYCEGPIDPEASLMLFEDADSNPIAGLLHYTCHPIHGYPHRYVSADWPGLWSEIISQKLGNNCVVGCINGACGNIAPNDHANPDYNSLKSLQNMLEHLAQTGEKLIASLEPVEVMPLKSANRIVKIQWRPMAQEQIDKARQLIKDHPTPMFLDDKKESIDWDWVFALRTLDVIHKNEGTPEYDFEIQVFSLGNLVIVGWPGEPFVEAQLEVKLKSPAKYTIVAHECNDECGYLPTLKATERGGYEAWGKFSPGTLEKITSLTIDIVKTVTRSAP